MDYKDRLFKSSLSRDHIKPLHEDSCSDDSNESLEVAIPLPSSSKTDRQLRTYDAIVFDLLRVPPEHIASQITLQDLPVFGRIQPEELSTCSWMGKDKHTSAPNIVAFTNRFNQLNFLVQKEVLSSRVAKGRCEVLSHFIKVAKKLLDLNNLHSCMAVLSSLQSAPIFRLAKTWALLSRKDRLNFDKLTDLFNQADNKKMLRDYTDSVKLPCIPYLGIYLTDIVYIDVAHPHSGGLESRPRRLKMNNILRTIAEFQQSSYDNLPVYEHVQNYLNSVRYIEELQKFVEDDNYRLSLQIEPIVTSSVTTTASTPPPPTATIKRQHHNYKSCHHIHTSNSMKIGKSKNLKDPELQQLPCQEDHFATASSLTTTRHLLDDSVLSPGLDDEASVASANHDNNNDVPHFFLKKTKDRGPGTEGYKAVYDYEGCLKRRVVLKQGKKPALTSWTRYWVGLWRSMLVYFPARCLKGVERPAFREDPCKMAPMHGCVVVLKEKGILKHDTFTITDPNKGNIYKFKTLGESSALDWCQHLDKACRSGADFKPPGNLITFE